jgi:succinate dehydrogenase/fumarate reductase flavoprotein subunit
MRRLFGSPRALEEGSREMKTVACDVLVVGSGVDGFTAALKLRSQGQNVLMVEKEPRFGGTSAYSAGMPWVPANRVASEKGDTAEKAMQYLESEAGNRLNRERAEAFLANCNAAIDFLEANSPVRFTAQLAWSDYHPDSPGAASELRGLLPEVFDGRRLGKRFAELMPPLRSMMLFGGMMVGREDLPHLFNIRSSPRSALYCARIFTRYLVDRLRYPRGTRLANGNGLIAALATAAFEKGIDLWLSSPLTRLTVENGAITGAIVRKSGEDIEIRAGKAVVLACGGFPWNDELRARYFPDVAAGKKHVSAAPRGNAGDGIRLAMEAGAIFDDSASNAAAWTPISLVPQKSGPPVPFPHFIDRAKPGVIVVDRRGRRFANEAVSYHDFVPKMFEACRDDPEVEAFVVADHPTFRKYGLGAAAAAPAPFGAFLRSGYLMRGSSLADLAAVAGIDPDGLTATVARFNEGAARGVDPQFGKGADSYQRFNGDKRHGPNPCVAPVSAPPFYAVRIVAGDLGTFMGLKTDSRGRVVNDHGAIPGLYAVGNDAASVFAGAYPGPGSTIGPVMTFAYLAATDIGSG